MVKKDWKGNWKQRIQGEPQPPIAIVTWLDACSNSGVCLEAEAGWEKQHKTGTIMCSVGYLLRNDKSWIVIAQDMHKERGSGFRQIMDIPAYAVCELKVVDKGVKPR